MKPYQITLTPSTTTSTKLGRLLASSSADKTLCIYSFTNSDLDSHSLTFSSTKCSSLKKAKNIKKWLSLSLSCPSCPAANFLIWSLPGRPVVEKLSLSHATISHCLSLPPPTAPLDSFSLPWFVFGLFLLI
ncbi:hypothetical protein RJT34_18230 [Clitoria ternatea]|uniref:Uncharacterized protein n=1 Tax=Clitoria ternatea TaxID=43366 RepID=A0AAN9PF85_CLITE